MEKRKLSDILEDLANLLEFEIFGGKMHKLVRGAFKDKSSAQKGIRRMRGVGMDGQIVPIKEFGKRSWVIYKEL